jgi:hypothetical protein
VKPGTQHNDAHRTKRRKLSSVNPQGVASELEILNGEASSSHSSILRNTLVRYMSWIIAHPSVLAAPASIQTQLRMDVSQFLKAHIQQLRYNMRFKSTSFYNWLHATGSIHTSCPMSFTFYTCLISRPSQYCFKTSRQRYLAEILRRHLANMCRIYNDWGSIERDRREGNLNSADFQEFEGVCEVKKALIEIAELERMLMVFAMRELKKGVDTEVADSVRLFVDVTDLYGQIYIERDIGIVA